MRMFKDKRKRAGVVAKENRDVVISVRVTPAQAADIERQAVLCERTVSDYIRLACVLSENGLKVKGGVKRAASSKTKV